jgi:hypothetical protein
MRAGLLVAALTVVPMLPGGALAQDAAPPVEAGPDCAGQWTLTPEYVLWWLRRGHIPPILTTSSGASRSVLGPSDTHILYGDDRLETRHGDRFGGVRLALEWLAPSEAWGVEGRSFFLERDSTHFRIDSNGALLLARPFLDENGNPSSNVIAGPTNFGQAAGSFVGYSRIEWFGQEINGVVPLVVEEGGRLDLLAGARFFEMRDRTDLTSSGHPLANPSMLFGQTDHFRAFNLYAGGQAGLRGAVAFGRLTLDGRAVLGLGGNQEKVRAWGDQVVAVPGTRTVTGFGLAVLPSNAGRFIQGDVNWTGELAVNVGYQLASWARLFAGYTFLYWDAPLRAGDQIDVRLNLTQLTATPSGPRRPVIPFKEDALWGQGVNAGVELRW